VPGVSSLGERPEVAPIRPGEELPWDRVVSWLRGRVRGLDGEFKVMQFPNGSANLTYLLSFGDKHLVLRRPPFGGVAPGAHDMRREFKVLSRLWAAFPAAPRAYALGTDPGTIGTDFIVMEYRAGTVVWDAIPQSMAGHHNVGKRIGYAVIDALADLHRIDPATCDLADLGRPRGFLQRQLEGWRKRWDLVKREDVAVMDGLGTDLAMTIPDSDRTSILHNDYKLNNCQFEPNNPDSVHSIFDWDMATLGDPLVDLGILLNYWPDRKGSADEESLVLQGTENVGLPSRAEVIERYCDRSGIAATSVGWYEAFASYKTAVVLQQLYARWERGESSDPRMKERGRNVKPLAIRSRAILDMYKSGKTR